jgi:hypothetical protein
MIKLVLTLPHGVNMGGVEIVCLLTRPLFIKTGKMKKILALDLIILPS